MTAESYNEKYAPLLGEWTIKRCIGSGSYGRVFEIERRDALGTVNTSALKIISLPQSEDDLRSTIETNNLTGDSVSSYYRSCADAITNEIKLMSELKAQSNIVSYEDHKIVPHKDGIGWDILIRMELLTPLNVHLQRTVQMPRGEVVRMGIRLCSALELCQRHNVDRNRDVVVKAECACYSRNRTPLRRDLFLRQICGQENVNIRLRGKIAAGIGSVQNCIVDAVP